MRSLTLWLSVTCLLLIVFVAGQMASAAGMPHKPYGLHGVNVTYNSFDVAWTSGDDNGFKQHFGIIRYLGNGTSTYQILATNISGDYNGSGSGRNWTHHLDGLYSNTSFRLTVTAQNERGTSRSDIVTITTQEYPPQPKDYTAIYVAIFVSLSTVISLIVFFVYLVLKRRRLASGRISNRTGLIQSGQR